MLKYLEFIIEHKDSKYNRDFQKTIKTFTDFNNKNYKFVKSLFKGDNVDDAEVIKKYEEFIKFRDGADYLRKEPKFIYLFFKLKEEGRLTEQELEDLYIEIRNHKNTIKQYKIELLHLETAEEITDELAKVKLIEKTNKFVKLLPTHLRTLMKKSFNALDKFKNMLIGYSYNDYKNVFLLNVNYYKTLDQFFDGLDAHLRTFISKSEIYNNIEEHPGADIVYSTEDFLVARIYSEKASQDLGSSQWCISYLVNSYWDRYMSDVHGHYGGERPGVQYFIWDFRFSPSDRSSLCGVTSYVDNNNVGHYKDDVSFDYRSKDWAKYLTPFGDLTEEEKVRLIADNPIMEEYTGVINNLDEKKKRKLLQQVPKLLLHFNDLSFLSSSEIWSLVKRDTDLAKHISIARELSEDQLIYLVVKNPDLLELSVDNNPYKSITSKLDRRQRIEMISNKHSLYTQFTDLTDDEKFELIKLDPRILTTHIEMGKEVDQEKLEEIYLENKDAWDNAISSVTGEKKIIIQLLFTHLIKDDDRIDMEEDNNCFILVAEKLNTNYDNNNLHLNIADSKITYVKNILSPENLKISTAMLMAAFNVELTGYCAWVHKDLIDINTLDNDEFIFESSIESLVSGTSEIGNEQEIYNDLMKSYVLLTDMNTQ